MNLKVMWYPTFNCNYNCAYCVRHDNRLVHADDNQEDLSDKWIEVFNKLGSMYNKIKVVVTGGEPTTLPWTPLVIQRSPANMRFNFNSNVSIDLVDYLGDNLLRIDQIICSLHFSLQHNGSKLWYKRVKRIIQEYPHISCITTFVRHQWYSQEEVQEILRFMASTGATVKYHKFLNREGVEHKPVVEGEALCNGGVKGIVLFPDGTVFRCCGNSISSINPQGNVFEGWLPKKEAYPCNHICCLLYDNDYEKNRLIQDRSLDPTPLNVVKKIRDKTIYQRRKPKK